MSALTILSTEIRQLDGLYSLNDLHKAAGGEAKHRPSYFLNNQQTNDLIGEIQIAGIPAIIAKQGLGTYACRELLIAYAAWISAAFHLKVIRVFLEQVKPELLQIQQQFITAAQAGELATLIKERFPDGIDRAYAWSRFNKHFRIARYRELPASHFMEACRYIPTMPGKDEIKQLTGQSVKLLPKPDYLLPPDQAKEIMDRLNRLGKMFHPFSDQFLDVLGVIRALHGRNPKLGLEESGYRKVI